ncbi:MAG: hypothetical protein ACXACR_15020 [Candidatus Hodarchaeales archaeon]|jgi:hypothetical protein
MRAFELDTTAMRKMKTELGTSTLKVFKTICDRWPTNPLEVANEHGDKGKAKSLSAKYLYHFRKLEKARLIHMKRLGNTYIAWPVDMEKLRVIHELLREGE